MFNNFKKELQIVDKITASGYEAYFIGGCVRDFLLNKLPHDIDIVTSATTEELERIFPDRTINCGNCFQVTLIDDIEVATYRKDKVDSAEIAQSLEEDCIRRDFTCNAIAYDTINNIFIDYVGGIEDIENRLLKFVGDPVKRIKEDPIRILRGLRFASQFNFSIEYETYYAMFILRGMLRDIPKERITKEVIKAFSTNKTYEFLTLLDDMEMLEIVFPAMSMLKTVNGGRFHNETVLHHCINAVKAIDSTKNVNLKLSAFYHDIGKYKWLYNAEGLRIFKGHNANEGIDFARHELSGYLRFPNSTVDYVVSMIKLHMADIDSPKSVRKLNAKLFSAGIKNKDFIYLRYADDKGSMLEHCDFKKYKQAYKSMLLWLKSKPPTGVRTLAITGKDVMNILSIPQGKEVGEILNTLLDLVLSGNLSNTKIDLENYIKWRIKDE